MLCYPPGILLFVVVIALSLPLQPNLHWGELHKPLDGREIRNLDVDELKGEDLVIKLDRTFPCLKNGSDKWPENEVPAAGEHIMIFRDGEVFSARYVSTSWIDEYMPDGFVLDKTWKNVYGTYITRKCIYHISEAQVADLLGIVGMYSGDMVPGKAACSPSFYANVRVIKGEREGRLREMVCPDFGDDEKMKIIDQVFEKMEAIEKGAAVKAVGSEEYIAALCRKKCRFGWFASCLQPSRIYRTAREISR